MGLSLALSTGKAPGPSSVATCPAGTSESLLPTALLQNLRDLGSVSRPRSQLIFCCRILVNESCGGMCWPCCLTERAHQRTRMVSVQTGLSPSHGTTQTESRVLLMTMTEASEARERADTGLGGTHWLSDLLCEPETRSLTSWSLRLPLCNLWVIMQLPSWACSEDNAEPFTRSSLFGFISLPLFREVTWGQPLCLSEPVSPTTNAGLKRKPLWSCPALCPQNGASGNQPNWGAEVFRVSGTREQVGGHDCGLPNLWRWEVGLTPWWLLRRRFMSLL